MEKSKVLRMPLPDKMAEKIYFRVAPILGEYHRQQNISSGSFDDALKPMTEKGLCVSAYTQGLIDAVELHKAGHLDQFL